MLNPLIKPKARLPQIDAFVLDKMGITSKSIPPTNHTLTLNKAPHMSAIFEELIEKSNGRDLVDAVETHGLEVVLQDLTEEEVSAIVEKFSADEDFNNYVEEVTAPTDSAAASTPGEISFDRFFNAQSGDDLVGMLRELDLSEIAARLTPEQITQIVEKFSTNPAFNAYVVEVTTPAVEFPDLPVLDPTVVLPTGAALTALVTQAEQTGQGSLYQSPTGFIFNQYGEQMLLDSSGNLAPAPRDVPVGMMKDASGKFVPDPSWEAPTYGASAAIGSATPSSTEKPSLEDAIFHNFYNAKDGSTLVSLIQNSNLGEIVSKLDTSDVDRVLQKFATDDSFNSWLASPTDNPAKTPSNLNSAGQSTELPSGEELNDLIDYAQNNGQGDLYYDDSGALVNEYGETMVLDSNGNLAPAARDVPVGMESDGNGGFTEDPDWQAPTFDDSQRADAPAPELEPESPVENVVVIGVPMWNELDWA